MQVVVNSPLLKVKDNKVVLLDYTDKLSHKLEWKDLLTSVLKLPEQCIEYIDLCEINDKVISTESTTIIKNSSNLEVKSLFDPWGACQRHVVSSQSVTQKYVSVGYGKASYRDYATNFNKRFDTFNSVLYYVLRNL